MEFSILYAIQNMHCNWLDHVILTITNLMGNYGQIWLIVAAVLLLFKTTRKTGLCVLLSYGVVFVVGQYVLKDLIARARPCHIDETVQLLISRPSSYSCPSTHTGWAFAAAFSIFLNHRKTDKLAGITALIVAAVIGFSRMYLFVHFPTDVLFGIVLGIMAAVGSYALLNVILKKNTAEAGPAVHM